MQKREIKMGKHRNKGQSKKMSETRKQKIQQKADLIIAAEQDPTQWGGEIIGQSIEGRNVYKLFNQVNVLLLEDDDNWYFDIMSTDGQKTGFIWESTAKTGVEKVRDYLISKGELMV